tara:strand:+ start:706 stop:1014 length:309 start_codon:yes stop_codon:yes gene_type:complete
MDKLVQYTYSCSNAMFKFLRDNDIDKLVEDLRRIEQHAYSDDDEPKDKDLWFKFGSDDTGATDIRNIVQDLNGTMNKEYLIDLFKMVTEDLDPDKELRVFFS